MQSHTARRAVCSPTLSAKMVSASLLTALAVPVAAANFSFTGTFGNPNEMQPFEFSIEQTQVVSVNTLSSLGGTNAAGNEIANGGFDPIVSLFSPAGKLIALNDDTFGLDSFIVERLEPGNYQVALTSFALFPNGPHISNGFCCNGFGTGHWALDIMNVDAASQLPSAVIVPTNPIPEPEIYALLLAGLGLVGLAAARRNNRS